MEDNRKAFDSVQGPTVDNGNNSTPVSKSDDQANLIDANSASNIDTGAQNATYASIVSNGEAKATVANEAPQNIPRVKNDDDGRDSANESDASSLESDECTGSEVLSGEESDLEDNVELMNEAVLLHWKNRNTLPPTNLPATTTILKTSDGCQVYLVGTIHFSHESQNDVAKTIMETQPDIVMVELCQSRANILAMDEERILEESKNMNLEKVRLAIKQNGMVQGIMYLLLLSMSAHLTKQLGMAPGGEFRRAYLEARRVPGCMLHLGDRPIQVTLQRALAALSWWQKLSLAWYIFTSKEPITKEEVERFKKSDLLEELLAEMTGDFPALSRVFVAERDLYLAYSLKLAATPVQGPQGPIPSIVVGVVGIGHVPGIVENWEKVTEEDIKEILKVPKPSLTSKIVRGSIRTAVVGVVVWGACRLLLPSNVYSALSPKRAYAWTLALLNK